MKRFLWVMCLAAGWASVTGAADRPNVLFIMSDDHAATAIGAYGEFLAELNPTPHIDRLAREGVLLEKVFCTNSICSPSRANILSGQHSQANGVLTLNGPLPTERQHLAREMGAAGYQTAILGKWHLKVEPGAFEYYKVLPGQGAYFDPLFRVRGPKPFGQNTVKEQGHSSDVIGSMAIDWFQSKRDKSRPFFMCLHFKAPHGPWSPAERYEDYLADVEIPEPFNLFKDGHHGSLATNGHEGELSRYIGASVGHRNPLRNQVARMLPGDYSHWDETKLRRFTFQHYLKEYLRCVKGVDDNVGRVLDYLDRIGELDNTVVMYTGDQGMWLGEHDYIDKRWMYEESMRMPLLVRYPRSIPAGSRSDALINNTDFAPTMLEFAGVKTPDYMHGRSFKSILETGKKPAGWRDATYYRYWMHLTSLFVPAHFGIRTDRYKLIFFYGSDDRGGGSIDKPRTPPGWELYDLVSDPHEMNNLYGHPAYAQVTDELKVGLRAMREEYGETDESRPGVRAIIDRFWEDSEANRAEAIRISHDAAAKLREDAKKGPITSRRRNRN
ncbi:MAG: sulfatase family protein [Planctomycetota bacterium]|jgi:N-acetylglucosamine-6-sulfatase